MPAARRRADSAAVLLRASEPVRKAMVGSNVIKLRSRLVVPGAPGCCAVDAHDRALVTGDNHSLWIVRIDPELVIVVTTRRALDGCPLFTGIGRTIDRRVHHINDVRVLWIDSH